MKQYLLGIDVGTTGTKAMLFCTDGQLCGHAYRPYAMHNPQVGYSEQNAEDWWQAVCQTVKEVCADPTVAENVAAISLSLQGGTVVPVDGNGEPLRRAIVWNDYRAQEQKEAYLREVGDADSMYQKTGWELDNGLPAMEIRWLRENEPEIFAKTAMFLTVPDYIAMKMTGVAAIDPSDAGINQLSDIRKGEYDDALLQFAGITRQQLPKILPSGTVVGNLTQEAAKALGLTTKTVLVTGAHDQYAVALGAGAYQTGDILIGSGTCWVVTALDDRPGFETGLSQSVAAVPGMWGLLQSLSSGGVCLEWLRRNLTDGPEGQQLSYDTINQEVSSRRAAHDGLFFYPFSGKAGDANFQKGSFVGMDLSHDKFHLARAIMEGVVFQTVWMMESFRSKPSAEGLKLAGGASKSRVWCQMLADIANVPVRIPEVADLACVGAAILAGVGCGIYADAKEGYGALSVQEQVILPDPQAAEQYAKLYQQYKQMACTLGTIPSLL